ncbi:MAG: serine hydrolase [Dokdonella sp.]
MNVHLVFSRARALAASFALAFALPGHATEAHAPSLRRADVEHAIALFKPILEHTIHASGVPGVAVGVVFDDQLIWSGSYGVREVGKPAHIDDHSLFQLASISKPIGATVIARLVGDGRLQWDDAVVKYLPALALSDEWVTRHVTLADLYSHRSGLPDHAGDDLEEFGYGRDEIIARLRLEKLNTFRTSYAYTNFGITAAAEAAAHTVHMSWEDASRELLYKPAGMNSTTSRFDEYMASPDRAVPHVRHPDGHWSADFQQKPDAESPAGGVASNVVDMARWMRLQLNGGELDGHRIIAERALLATHTPHSLTRGLVGYAARPNQYGLGWFIDVDDFGQMRWSHSGTFALGAATNVALVPAQKLGIVILTNGFPVGLPESMSETFLDLVFIGKPREDWYAIFNHAFEEALYPHAKVDFRQPPPHAAPARQLGHYLGVYHNDYFGDLDLVFDHHHLSMRIGPAHRTFALGHYSGDIFWYVPPGEFGVVPSPVTFTFADGDVSIVIGKRQDDGSFADESHGPFIRRSPPPCTDGHPARGCTPPSEKVLGTTGRGKVLGTIGTISHL